MSINCSRTCGCSRGGRMPFCGLGMERREAQGQRPDSWRSAARAEAAGGARGTVPVLLRGLRKRGQSPPRIIVASIQSLLQPVPSREQLLNQTRRLRSATKWMPTNCSAGWPRGDCEAHGGRRCRASSPARRHRRCFRPRLGRPGADRTVRRSDRIDPARLKCASQRSLASLAAVEITVLTPSTAASRASGLLSAAE